MSSVLHRPDRSGGRADTVTGRYRRNPGGWLLLAALLVPLLLALLVTLVGGGAGSGEGSAAGSADGGATDTSTGQPASPSPQAAPVGDPISVTTTDGRRTVTATVPDDASRQALLEGVRANSEGVRVVDDITVDEAADAPPVTGVGTVLAAGRGITDLGMTVDRATLQLTGQAPDQATGTATVFAAGQSYPGVRLVDRLQLPGGAAAAAGPLSEQCRQVSEQVTTALQARPVTFDLYGATVDAASRAHLLDLGEMLAGCEFSGIEVAGHSDSTGPAEPNMRLSQQRAESVRGVLIEAGVPAGVVTARGYGSTQPVADDATEQGRAANRRVEITAT